MAWLWVVAGVLLAASSGAAIFLFYCWKSIQKLDGRLRVLEEPKHVYDVRYVSPEVSHTIQDVPSEYDIVGAWALEQERAGQRPTDDEISVQRRMWAEEAI